MVKIMLLHALLVTHLNHLKTVEFEFNGTKDLDGDGTEEGLQD